MNPAFPSSEDTFRKSSFFEQLAEHVFISEILQESYYGSGMTVEILRSEIDASGYWDDAAAVLRLVGRSWLLDQVNAPNKTAESH